MRAGEGASELHAGDVVARDSEVVAGRAAVDESAATGESVPVLRESSPGRNALLTGSRVQSGTIWVRPLGGPGATAGARQAPRWPWWPAPLAAAAWILGGAAARRPGPLATALLLLVLPPYLLILWSGARAATRRAFWRAMRAMPQTADALDRAASCDTLLVPPAGLWHDGSLAAVEFWPLPGVAVREVATAARQGLLVDEGLGRSVLILAKVRAGLRETGEIRTPLCGPPGEVAARVAACAGSWPPEAGVIERAIAARGGCCLAVADGGRPLGLVELRPRAGRPTLDEVAAAGLALTFVDGPQEIAAAAEVLHRRGRRVAAAWQQGAGAVGPAHFVLAGPAWAADRPTAIDLDADPTKLPEVLLRARRFWRRETRLLACAAALDLARAAAAVHLALLVAR